MYLVLTITGNIKNVGRKCFFNIYQYDSAIAVNTNCHIIWTRFTLSEFPFPQTSFLSHKNNNNRSVFISWRGDPRNSHVLTIAQIRQGTPLSGVFQSDKQAFYKFHHVQSSLNKRMCSNDVLGQNCAVPPACTHRDTRTNWYPISQTSTILTSIRLQMNQSVLLVYYV